jgi:hypothetical protein
MTTTEPTAAALVAQAGAAIYGAEWQNPLARALGMNERTMRRIAQAARAGEAYPVAPGALAELVEILKQAASGHESRARACETLAGDLARLTPP